MSLGFAQATPPSTKLIRHMTHGLICMQWRASESKSEKILLFGNLRSKMNESTNEWMNEWNFGGGGWAASATWTLGQMLKGRTRLISASFSTRKSTACCVCCRCSDDLPTSTSDLVNRLRDLLTLFNSRTCQLVLGAGALQLVGLKTITTKNLALASRCLQVRSSKTCWREGSGRASEWAGLLLKWGGEGLQCIYPDESARTRFKYLNLLTLVQPSYDLSCPRWKRPTNFVYWWVWTRSFQLRHS